MSTRSKPWVFGLTFMAISMAVETVLIVVGRLRVLRDNAIIAPILLIVSPLAAALICGYRRPLEVIVVSFLAVFFTLLLVMVFGRITGISTGIGPPIVLHTFAGLLAGIVSNRAFGSSAAGRSVSAG